MKTLVAPCLYMGCILGSPKRYSNLDLPLWLMANGMRIMAGLRSKDPMY